MKATAARSGAGRAEEEEAMKCYIGTIGYIPGACRALEQPERCAADNADRP